MLCGDDFFLQLLYLHPKPLVFGHFGLQVGGGKPGFVLDATGRQQVGVLQLAVIVLEVTRFHPPFFQQRSQAVVGFAQAHAQLSGHFPLGDAGVLFNKSEYPEVGVVIHGA